MEALTDLGASAHNGLTHLVIRRCGRLRVFGVEARVDCGACHIRINVAFNDADFLQKVLPLILVLLSASAQLSRLRLSQHLILVHVLVVLAARSAKPQRHSSQERSPLTTPEPGLDTQAHREGTASTNTDHHPLSVGAGAVQRNPYFRRGWTRRGRTGGAAGWSRMRLTRRRAVTRSRLIRSW